MSEAVVIEKKPEPPAFKFSPPVLPLAEEARGVQLAAGESEWLRGTLSKAVKYRLIMNGEFGPKEIGKLIKLLEAQKAVLDDDEDEE